MVAAVVGEGALVLGVLLVCLGLTGALLGGLVGIGGGILVAPLLLLVPPWFGQPALDIATVAGITSLQSMVAAISGAIGHSRHAHLDWRLFRAMGVSIALAAAAGSLASRWVPAGLLAGAFAGIALVAGLLMLSPGKLPVGEVKPAVPSGRAAAWGAGIGLLGGMLGQGGGFLIAPTLIRILQVPTRVALGTALAVAAASSAAGLAGKWATGQVPGELALLVSAGAAVGAQAGSSLSRRLSARWLHRLLGMLVVGAALQVTAQAVMRWGWSSTLAAAVTVALFGPLLRRTWAGESRETRPDREILHL